MSTQHSVPDCAPHSKPGETPWLTGAQKPVRIGVYRRLNSLGYTTYSYWDGRVWLWNKPTPEQAASAEGADYSLVQVLPWCGLVAPPPQGYVSSAKRPQGVPC